MLQINIGVILVYYFCSVPISADKYWEELDKWRRQKDELSFPTYAYIDASSATGKYQHLMNLSIVETPLCSDLFYANFSASLEEIL